MATRRGRKKKVFSDVEPDEPDEPEAESVLASPVRSSVAAVSDVQSLVDQVDAEDAAERAAARAGEEEGGHALVEIDHATVHRFRSRGLDPTVYALRIWKWNHVGKAVQIPGQFPPHGITSESIRARWGAGDYRVAAVNKRGIFIASSRHTIEEVEGEQPVPLRNGGWSQPTVPATAFGSPPPSGGDGFLQQMVLTLLAKPKEEDSMRDAISGMVKLMALNMQMQAQQALTAKPAATGNEEVVLLLRELLSDRRKSEKREPSFSEVLPMLQMGMNLGRMTSGAGTALALNPEDQIPAWLKVMPQLADTVGVPLLATIAQAVLPPDKAKAVVDVMAEHMKARQAEAAPVDEEPEQ